MKTICTLIMSAALASAAFAGTPTIDYSKGSKTVTRSQPEACPCFGPGFAMGIFGAGYFPAHGPLDDAAGGGVLFEYFFNEYVGIQVNYGAFATDPVHHVYGGDLVLRYPIRSICLAPYFIGGGGCDSDGENRGYGEVGGGLEYRIESWDCMGIFADAMYHFSDDSHHDFTTARLGIKFRF